MRQVLSVCVLAFLAVGTVACGDDPTGSAGDLTDQELEELAEVVFGDALSMGFQSFDPATSFEGDPDLGVSAAAVPFSFEFGPDDLACPLGGSVTVTLSLSGDVDETTNAGSISLGVTQDHADCVVESESGTRFTLNGNPNTTTSVDMSVDAAQDFTLTGTFGGGVHWATGGRSDACSIALSIDASGNLTAETLIGTVSGTMCGRDVSQSLS